MKSENENAKERMLGKIDLLQSHVRQLVRTSNVTQVRIITMELNDLIASFEQVQHNHLQALISLYLASIDEGLDQDSHTMHLAKIEGLIDHLSKYTENRQLAMLQFKEYTAFNWNEIRDLNGSS